MCRRIPASPSGCAKSGGKSVCSEGHIKRYGATVEKYAKWVKHRNSSDAPDAVETYRRVLAAQPDGSVVICSVGFLNNLRHLIESPPDAISPLDGKALVARKVKLWVAMACKYLNGREYNSATDAEASRIAISNWPTQGRNRDCALSFQRDEEFAAFTMRVKLAFRHSVPYTKSVIRTMLSFSCQARKDGRTT